MADLAEAEEAIADREDELEAAQRALAEEAAAATAAAESQQTATQADDGAILCEVCDGGWLVVTGKGNTVYSF